MSRQLPPLAAIRAFECAARHRGFARAAEELFVTPGAVGHQVRLLEEWMGFALFTRGARSVELTEAGRHYFEEVRAVLETLERASIELRDAPDAFQVTVSAMPSFVTRWLMPRLGSFRQSHPEAELRLLASVPPVDFARDRVDVAIRLGTGPYPQLVSELLMPETFRSVALPARCKDWKTPRDLLGEPLLHDEFEPRIPAQIDWPRWCAAQGISIRPRLLRQGLRFSHTYLTLDAAAAGQGVAVVSDVLASDAVRRGVLAWGPGEPVPGPYGYHLVMPRVAPNQPQVNAFCDWLREQARAFSGAPSTT